MRRVPYASTAEGGIGATIHCVVAAKNSKQGGLLSAFYAALSPGDRFVVEVVGIDCTTALESELEGCHP